MRTPEACLVALQRGGTPDDVWRAARSLTEVMVPGRYYVPVFLRTNMPMRDIGRFAELAPLNRVVAERPGLIGARMSDFYTAAPDDPFYEKILLPDGWMHFRSDDLLEPEWAVHRASGLAALRETG